MGEALFIDHATENSEFGRRLEQFAEQWRILLHNRSPQKRLGKLIIKLKPLLEAKRSSNIQKPVRIAYSCDISKLESILEAMRGLLNIKRERLNHNPWTMSGLGRYEVRNCAVLAQLWDSRVSGPPAKQFLSAYLNRLDSKNVILPTSEELSAGYTVRAEHCPTGAQTERVDLTIEGTHFLIGIEVKIDATEGPEQLERYKRVIAKRAESMNIHKNRQCIVFLAPYRTTVPDVLQSSWKDVGYAAHLVAEKSDKPYNLVAWLIGCFAEHSNTF